MCPFSKITKKVKITAPYCIISTHIHGGGAITNTDYDGMLTSFKHSADTNPQSRTRICGRQAMYT